MANKIAAVGNGKILLVEESDGSLRLPHEGELSISENSFSFSFNGILAISHEEASFTENRRISLFGLRDSWSKMPENEYAAAVKGTELINWHNSTRFCASCGTPLIRNSEISKICPDCGKEYFPSLFPAIVVLVMDGEKALLVHGKSLRKDVHAIVAGFVETGETLEQCVAREVKEETDLEITDIRYFGSQSWPFPHQLMIGFTAKLKRGTVRFADGELDAGGFFSRENLPLLPSPPSLTRRIIDAWINKEI